ncbi:hypothetical protein FOZ62_028850 [Perkinsus olseni]|uniref:Uncharacterized protein n=1 Tax=Perkinsus olseni TaxID=32597 RepID=A0A7J6RNQ2_PEROL|nr:hypothetical protein FOZ62_028850 [Perkinsus olseni]
MPRKTSNGGSPSQTAGPAGAEASRRVTEKDDDIGFSCTALHGLNEYDFPDDALALLTSRGRLRVADRGLNAAEILKSPRFIEACYRLGLRPSEVDLWHTQNYTKIPRPRFPTYATLDEADLPLDWRISCLAEALREYDTIIAKSSYVTQSFDEWMYGRPASTMGGSERGRSLSCGTLRSVTSPEEFAASAMTRMQSHLARLEKQQAAFMENEARRERARSRSAQTRKERDDLINQRMMALLDKERRQQMYRLRMERHAEATKRMRNSKRGDRFRRNKELQEHNRDELLRTRRDRERRLAEALAARAESRRAKRAALLGAERQRQARRREKAQEDERRKMALTEELQAKDTRSKDQLHRNKMEFDAFAKEAQRKRAISEHLVERRRRREKYLQNADADRQVLEAACDVEMKRMTLAMRRQRAEYDRRKFQKNHAISKKEGRPKSASVASLLPSTNHHPVLPRSPQWSIATRLASPAGLQDSSVGPGSYDIPSTVGADHIGPRWMPESVDQSELGERPVRYESPLPTSSPRSPSMRPLRRPPRGVENPGPGHRHEPVGVNRLPRPRDPRAIAQHFRLLVESGRQHLSLVSQSRVTAAAVANDAGRRSRGTSPPPPRPLSSRRRSVSSFCSSSSSGLDAEMEQAAAELAEREEEDNGGESFRDVASPGKTVNDVDNNSANPAGLGEGGNNTQLGSDSTAQPENAGPKSSPECAPPVILAAENGGGATLEQLSAEDGYEPDFVEE